MVGGRLVRTGLGEEGAEALIGLGGLALLCEVTIGLERTNTLVKLPWFGWMMS